MSAGSYFEVSDMSLHYGAKCAFESVVMSVPRGEVTALIGPSGCGKTSFLNCLNRLIDLAPGARVTGSVRAGGLDLYAPTTDLLALRRRIGMLFQKPNPFPLSIRRNLELPLREHGIRDKRRLEETVEHALRDVGLWEEVKDRLDRPALQLSGGQKQRLCLARALVLEPEALLMDEPCSALDPLASAVVEDLIKRLRGRYTLLVVTHHLAQARRLADHVGLFWMLEGRGKLIEWGPAGQIFEAPREALTAEYVRGRQG
ncbi:MAG: phosphate ABC transporter ATP-binding protein [Planctomycetes bacterium]|nr:phosphate ABC transporter ATP-binding protein [Planctomycetota bacterium]